MLASSPAARSRRVDLLTYAALVYLTGLVLHTADHVRRGISVLTPEVYWAGWVSLAAGVLTVALVFARHRYAPIVAAVAGIPIALGTAAVHLLPRWSAFSDAFPGAHGTGVTAFSWFVVLVEIVGALMLGVAGLSSTLRDRRAMRAAA